MTKILLYTFLSREEYDNIISLLPADFPGTVVPIACDDWNRDLSPWEAQRAFPKGEDFSGGADAFLQKLLEEILPEKEAELGLRAVVKGGDPTEIVGTPLITRYLLGYSLAGLFALYAATKTDLFEGVGSMSGSLWFDNFVEYLEANPISPKIRKVYLSVGTKEKNAKDSRMKLVEEKTIQAAEILKGRGVGTTLELNPGGHFNMIPERIAKGLMALAKGENNDECKEN